MLSKQLTVLVNQRDRFLVKALKKKPLARVGFPVRTVIAPGVLIAPLATSKTFSSTPDASSMTNRTCSEWKP